MATKRTAAVVAGRRYALGRDLQNPTGDAAAHNMPRLAKTNRVHCRYGSTTARRRSEAGRRN
eukprot:6848135-Lingulodinium_polyedra.AAC.1